jgi:hypothetical protein
MRVKVDNVRDVATARSLAAVGIREIAIPINIGFEPHVRHGLSPQQYSEVATALPSDCRIVVEPDVHPDSFDASMIGRLPRDRVCGVQLAVMGGSLDLVECLADEGLALYDTMWPIDYDWSPDMLPTQVPNVIRQIQYATGLLDAWSSLIRPDPNDALSLADIQSLVRRSDILFSVNFTPTNAHEVLDTLAPLSGIVLTVSPADHDVHALGLPDILNVVAMCRPVTD